MNANSQHEEMLFNETLGLRPEERIAFLNESCSDDAMRERILSLLEAHDQTGNILECDPLDAARGASFENAKTLDESALSEGPGTIIGPYKLLQKIGEGGFGAVYMAEVKVQTTLRQSEL